MGIASIARVDALEVREEREVLPRRETPVDVASPLQHYAHLAGVEQARGRIDAIDLNRPRGGRDQSERSLDERGLSGAVGTYQATTDPGSTENVTSSAAVTSP